MELNLSSLYFLHFECTVGLIQILYSFSSIGDSWNFLMMSKYDNEIISVSACACMC